MKFSCEKILLQQAISMTSKAVSLKSSIPALEGILLETNQQLDLTGYNLETGIKTTISADISQHGSLVLGARLFGEIIRKLPDDIVYFSAEGLHVTITCGHSKFQIIAIDPEEFPELPTIQYENSITLTQNQMKSMISRTLFAVSDNESRPIHTGALFDIDGMHLTVVAVDGYRLAQRDETLKEKHGEEVFSFVVPSAALSEIEKICQESDQEVTINQGNRHIMVKIGDTIVISRRLEGEFLNYKQAIPKQNSIHIFCDKRDLLHSIERVSLIINEKLKSPVHCLFQNNVLYLTSKTAIGEVNDQCAIEGDGQNLEIGFNNRYLLDALKHAPTDRLRLELNTGVSPCVIFPAEGEENFTYMVLPVRLRAGE